MPPFSARLRAATLVIAGLLPLWTLLPGYLLGIRLLSQVGPWRTLGTFVIAALAIAVAAPIAGALAVSAGLDAARGGLARLGRTAFFAGAIANVLAVGLAIYHRAPGAAPTSKKVIAAIVLVGLVGAFARYAEAEQRFVGRTLQALGLGILAALLLTTPAVVWRASADQVRVPAAVAPAAAELLPGAPRRVVLFSFDGLRARSTSQAAAGRTPALAALAARGTWFGECRAASDRTLCSMGSVLTGLAADDLFPTAGNRTGFLRQGAATGLAGHLAQAGYKSFYTTMLLGPEQLGLGPEFVAGWTTALIYPVGNELNGPGFVPWRESLGWLGVRFARLGTPQLNLHQGPKTVSAVVDAAITTLAREAAPTFLWVHVGAPHAPMHQVPASGPPVPQASPVVTFKQIGEADAAALAAYEATYESYVRFADAELGRFVRALQAAGLFEDTMLVVLADHGEEFAVGHKSHGDGYLGEDVAHVPLVVRYPRQTRAERVDRLVGHIDVVPTILAEVYRHPPAGLPGRALRTPPPADRALTAWGLARRYQTTVSSGESLAAWRLPYKYVVGSPGDHEALFDLRRDPRERHDVKAAHPEVLAELRAHVRAEVAD